MHVKFERVIVNSFPAIEDKFAFDLETGNVKGQSQTQGLQWKELKVYKRCYHQ